MTSRQSQCKRTHLRKAGPSGRGRGWAALSGTPFALVTWQQLIRKGAQHTYEVQPF